MSFFKELERRNVVRVAMAYVVAAWLIIQVVETIFPAFGFGDASIRGAKDDLLGLKENIIIGHLIPAGTGVYRYSEIEIEPLEKTGEETAPPSGRSLRSRNGRTRRLGGALQYGPVGHKNWRQYQD